VVSQIGGKTGRKVDAYAQGVRAWQDDQLTEANNPYDARTEPDEYAKWLQGFREARRKSLPEDAARWD